MSVKIPLYSVGNGNLQFFYTMMTLQEMLFPSSPTETKTKTTTDNLKQGIIKTQTKSQFNRLVREAVCQGVLCKLCKLAQL